VKISFVCASPMDFTPLTPYDSPLGGSESALCYLALHLAKRGHRVSVLCNTTRPGTYDNVECLNLQTNLGRTWFEGVDAIVSVSPIGRVLRQRGAHRPLLLWTGYDIDQPAIRVLRDGEERFVWDKYVFVSQWQAARYASTFRIKAGDLAVLPNAMAPPFQGAERRRPYFFEEGRPPVLMYSTTPFRGLDVLLEAFPRIREQVPGASARIFSSMKVYQTPDSQDFHRALYDKCRDTEGVEYIGSLGQAELARALAETDIFAYPSSFAETSCISLMEAMAVGCLAVTTDLGALSETASGFAHLLGGSPATAIAERAAAYAAFCTGVIKGACADPASFRDKLDKQRAYCRATYVWPALAERWEALLQDVSQAPPRLDPPRRNEPCPCGSGKRFKHCCGEML